MVQEVVLVDGLYGSTALGLALATLQHDISTVLGDLFPPAHYVGRWDGRASATLRMPNAVAGIVYFPTAIAVGVGHTLYASTSVVDGLLPCMLLKYETYIYRSNELYHEHRRVLVLAGLRLECNGMHSVVQNTSEPPHSPYCLVYR
jgi:hypothetical protein